MKARAWRLTALVVLVAGLVGLPMLPMLASLLTTGPATAFDQKVLARIDPEALVDHIRVLSEDIGPRVVSSPEEKRAAEYIAAFFAGLGYEVQVRPFPRLNTGGYLEVVDPFAERMLARVAAGSPETGPGG